MKKKIREKNNQKKQKSHRKTAEHSLCHQPTPGHKTCLPWSVVGKFSDIPFKKLIFFLLPKDNVLVRGEIFSPFSLASDGHLTPEYEPSICILSLDIHHQTVSIKIVIFPYFHHESSILELFKMKRNQNFYFCN